MDKIISLTPPLTNEVVLGLSAGDRVSFNGVLYTARDAAHKRLVALLDEGKPLPFDIRGQVIYYVGPTPARPGRVIGSAGPTTSYRMDAYTPALIGQGLKGMIGKGNRGEEVLEALKQGKAVYFAAVGGAGALISRCIVSSEIIAYEDLGPEAIRRVEVRDFRVVVANDAHGGDLFEEGISRYGRM
ncbi:MAG: Fe-S-containing hydro-lyase [Candidatus Glassbacteria bacterium]|nr:Fe-S-containing hydro-lyase [Candidatus Glassbacteria bacterium]